MPHDALDRGPNGDYPYWPRNPDGTSRMPFGLKKQRSLDGTVTLIDVTPRINGVPVGPPDHLAAVAAAGIT